MKKIYLLITFLLIVLLGACGADETPTTVVPTGNFTSISTSITTSAPTSTPTSTPTQSTTTPVVPSNASPVLTDDGKAVLYGYYPQTRVSDNTMISALETLSPSVNGWYFYEDSYYAKVTSTLYNGESYNFNNGDKILDNTNYWFKCESIKWRVLSVANNKYTLISDVLLDVKAYYEQYASRTIDGQEVFANNYEHSDIRKWLNNDFYNTAFALNNSSITEVTLDNSANTTDSNENKYAGNNTIDKVYLPSYKDMLSSSLGFDTSNGVSASRQAKTTDYARVRGAWSNIRDSQYLYNSTYWTRSATSQYYYCAWNVNSSGNLSAYAVDGNAHCVRPCITITL